MCVEVEHVEGEQVCGKSEKGVALGQLWRSLNLTLWGRRMGTRVITFITKPSPSSPSMNAFIMASTYLRGHPHLSQRHHRLCHLGTVFILSLISSLCEFQALIYIRFPWFGPYWAYSHVLLGSASPTATSSALRPLPLALHKKNGVESQDKGTEQPATLPPFVSAVALDLSTYGVPSDIHT